MSIPNDQSPSSTECVTIRRVCQMNLDDQKHGYSFHTCNTEKEAQLLTKSEQGSPFGLIYEQIPSVFPHEVLEIVLSQILDRFSKKNNCILVLHVSTFPPNPLYPLGQALSHRSGCSLVWSHLFKIWTQRDGKYPTTVKLGKTGPAPTLTLAIIHTTMA